MSDLISRKVLLEEIQLIEKSLLKDKAEAKEIGDKEVIFAIDNQLSGLWLARCKVGNIKAAYDVDEVVEELENKMFTAKLYEYGWNGQTVKNLVCFGDVYEIVKGGLEE